MPRIGRADALRWVSGVDVKTGRFFVKWKTAVTITSPPAAMVYAVKRGATGRLVAVGVVTSSPAAMVYAEKRGATGRLVAVGVVIQ